MPWRRKQAFESRIPLLVEPEVTTVDLPLDNVITATACA